GRGAQPRHGPRAQDRRGLAAGAQQRLAAARRRSCRPRVAVNPGLRAGLARLIASQVSVHACMTGFRMAAPLMALREGHSPLSVGILLALFALAPVFLALPAGRFADRHAPQRPVRLAVRVASVGGLLAVAWPAVWVLCLSAVACGAASGVAMITLLRLVGRLAHDGIELRQVFSWMAVGPSISSFLG